MKFEITKIRSRVPSIEEVWEKDKTSLQRVYSQIPLNWKGRIPTSQDYLAIHQEVMKHWQHPERPLLLSPADASAMIQNQKSLLEARWKLNVPLNLSIVPYSRYLPSINAAIKEIDGLLHLPHHPLQSPPAAIYQPFTNEVTIATEFPVRFLNQNHQQHDYLNQTQVQLFPWEEANLQTILNEEFSHAFFRTLRGENREGYLKVQKAIGVQGYNHTVPLNEIIAQYVKDQVVIEKPLWALYGLYDKLGTVWDSRSHLDMYRAVTALLGEKSLEQVSGLDHVALNQYEKNKVYCGFMVSHPHHSRKKEKFTSE